MLKRTALGRIMDGLVLSVVLFLVCSVIFISMTRNILTGLGLAAPVTLLFLYALRLWRRRAAGTETLTRNARYHLQNLMLQSETKALRFILTLMPRFGLTEGSFHRNRLKGNLEGQSAEIFLLRKPLDSGVDAEEILRCYHRTSAARCVIVSTAPFEEQACVFARLRADPSVTLIGPEELLPLLRDIPAGDEPKKEEKEQRRVLLSRLKERATEPRRRSRCMLYGVLMIIAYIVWNAPTFLFPGLVCVFLAVISGHGERIKTFREKK